MALAVQLVEEGEFHSRACEAFYDEEEATAPSEVVFRWSAAVNQLLQQSSPKTLQVNQVVLATHGSAQQFMQQVTFKWHVIGTIILSNQPIRPMTLADGMASECVILSRDMPQRRDDGAVCTDQVAVLLNHSIADQDMWQWLTALQRRLHSQQLVCLDSQMSAIYDHPSQDEADWQEPATGCSLFQLHSDKCTKPINKISQLPTPNFLTGLSAAALTLGQLRQQSVQVFVNVHDPTCSRLERVSLYCLLHDALGLDLAGLMELRVRLNQLSASLDNNLQNASDSLYT